MKISLILAMSLNNVIGDGNKLLWNIKADLKRFKEITMGHTILMGSKTYYSIGRPLPGRRNVVLSKKLKNGDIVGVEIINDIKDIEKLGLGENEELICIGGAQLYNKLLPYDADKIYMTHVFGVYSGDAVITGIDWKNWEWTYKSEVYKQDDGHLSYLFCDYVRKKWPF